MPRERVPMKPVIALFMLLLALPGCSSFPKKDNEVSPWAGQFRRDDGAYDLFVDQVEPDVVEASIVPAGKSPKVHDDVESFMLARIQGVRASRISLPGHDCYLGLEKSAVGLKMIDGCGGDLSGSYKPFSGK